GIRERVEHGLLGRVNLPLVDEHIVAGHRSAYSTTPPIARITRRSVTTSLAMPELRGEDLNPPLLRPKRSVLAKYTTPDRRSSVGVSVLPIREHMFVGRRPPFTEEQARDAIARASNWTEALALLGYRNAGGNHATLKRYVAL